LKWHSFRAEDVVSTCSDAALGCCGLLWAAMGCSDAIVMLFWATLMLLWAALMLLWSALGCYELLWATLMLL